MNRLLIDILSSVWLIDDERSSYYASLLLNLIEGRPIAEGDLSIERAKAKSFVVASDNSSESLGLNSDNIPSGSIAIIPIRSEIMKYDQACGPRGTMSLIEDINSANNNPDIAGIILLFDSPGGQVSGIDLLAEAVKNSAKPVVSYVEGICASAAVWIAAGSDKIFASSDLDRIGSIGTMLAFADMKPTMEKAGVKFHEIYATLSTEKNRDMQDVLSGKYDDIRKSLLDPINNKFIGHVTGCRPHVDEKALKGKLFFAKDAISAGLIDGIKSFQETLNYVSYLAESQSNVQFKTNDMKFSAKWNAILSVLGITGETAEAEEMTAERIGLLDQELSSLKAKNEELALGLSTEAAGKQTALDQLAAEQAAHAVTKKELEDLKAEDAAGQTTVGKDKDKITGEGAAGAVNGFDQVADKFLGK